MGQHPVYRWIPISPRQPFSCLLPCRRTICRCLRHSTSIVWWGQCYGVGRHGRTPLAVVAGNLTGMHYWDEIVQPYVIPFIQAQANNVTFQQDNAWPYVVRVVRDYLTQQNVDLLPWPAVSPDLSPIKHVWDEMEWRLRQISQWR